jgi:hypothetical protein
MVRTRRRRFCRAVSCCRCIHRDHQSSTKIASGNPRSTTWPKAFPVAFKASSTGLKDRDDAPFGTWHHRFIDWFRDLGFLQKPGVETKAAKEVAAYVTRRRTPSPPK